MTVRAIGGLVVLNILLTALGWAVLSALRPGRRGGSCSVLRSRLPARRGRPHGRAHGLDRPRYPREPAQHDPGRCRALRSVRPFGSTSTRALCGARLDTSCLHLEWRAPCAARGHNGGGLPERSPSRSDRVRRLGLVGPEDEGALPLRSSRSPLSRGAPGRFLPAGSAGAPGHGIARDRLGGRRHAASRVLVSGAGFVAAVLGLLATRVRPLLLLPFVLIIFVLPDIRSRSVDMYGDLPLGFLVATAALLVALWLDERRRWQLPAASLLFAAAALTKREGVILAGCVVVAALAASSDRMRSAWPRLVAVFLAALAATLLWQIWLWAHALPGNGPSGGLHFLTDGRRGWGSLHVVTKSLHLRPLAPVADDRDRRGRALPPRQGVAPCSLLRRCLIVTLMLGSTVILCRDPNLQLTDVNVVSRLVGTVTLTVVRALTPLALQRAWDGGERQATAAAPSRPVWQVGLAWTLVAYTGAIAYPTTCTLGATLSERRRLHPRAVGRGGRAGGARTPVVIVRCRRCRGTRALLPVCRRGRDRAGWLREAAGVHRSRRPQ